MPSIKIFPPKQLLDKGLSKHAFEAWTSELEVFLCVDNDKAIFLQNGSYSSWQSEKTPQGKIQQLNAADELTVNREVTEPEKMAILNKKRKELKKFLN